jgi:hypothetical protein
MNLEQRKIAVTLDNGDLAVMSLLTVGRGNNLPALATWINDAAAGWWRRPDSDAVILDELARTFPERDGDGVPRPQPVRFRRIADDALPVERTYRGAWAEVDGAIVHDMPRARALHLAMFRRARAERLDELDRNWMRATGQGKKHEADEIENERQRLRDLPATLGVEAAQTVEDLKALGGF